MKKLLIDILCLVMLGTALFAQNSSVKANRNTAIRCLKLSETYLVKKDWDNALTQSNLGLSYDDSISDLYYVEASALINLGASKTKVINIVNKGFEKNDWVDYNKNGARILLADLLCDTGEYEKSLKVLDEESFVFSADAEFIRIKNYYRIGTPQALENARTRVENSRRVYASDLRFPRIFFMFEFMYKMTSEFVNGKYDVPPVVQKIADSYIIRLPDYSGEKTDVELLASFFAEDSVRKRLISAIDAKNQTRNPLLALGGLKTGLYSDERAYDLFFEYSENEVSLFYLECLAYMLEEDDVRQLLLEKLVNFDGTIVIDENSDLQNEMTVTYSLGRPQYINYDSNNDGEREIFATCDSGVPSYVLFDDAKTELYYDIFPYVKQVYFTEKDYRFNFLYDDFYFSPVNMYMDPIIKNYGLNFWVPVSAHAEYVLDYQSLSEMCTTLELPLTERENAKIIYTMLKGSAVFADFYEGENHYGYADFVHGIPFVRYADYDFDGVFETSETFDVTGKRTDAENEEIELSDPLLIASIFNEIANSMNVIMKKTEIDRNANTFHEYSEEYLPDGRICCWDDNDDGIIDCKYTQKKVGDGDSISEETVYYNKDGSIFVSINTLNSIPLRMTYEGRDVLIFAGKNKNFYWINDRGTDKAESEALAFASGKVVQGDVHVLNADSNRVFIIKVGENYFCRLLQPEEYADVESSN